MSESILEKLVGNGSTSESMFSVRVGLDKVNTKNYVEKEQFIGVMLNKEEFCVPIAEIREIIMMPPVTYVPYSNPSIEGVINLRGSIVPVINLRRIINLPKPEQINEHVRIVIVKPQESEELFGIIVDGITQVMAFLPNQIETNYSAKNIQGTIKGVAKKEDKVLAILDLERIAVTSRDETEEGATA